MRIDDAAITRRLETIRLRHGLNLTPFIPQPPDVNIDEDIDRVENLFHPSGLLVRNGQPVLAYIRDHTSSFVSDLAPAQCRRVHFTVCATLDNMKSQGRFERYRITNRKTNRYLVDARTAWGETEEREIKLYPCQHCLRNIKYRNFNYTILKGEKSLILENFDVKEVFPLLRRSLTRFHEQRFHEQNAVLRRATANAKPATLPSGYPENWKEISGRVRQLRNYTCEKCGVRLPARLLDAHHVDGDKQNVRDSNLRCLCKLCHQAKHPHYKVTDTEKILIKAEQARQGII